MKTKQAYILFVLAVVLVIVIWRIKKMKIKIKQCGFFTVDEFDSPDVRGSGKNMKPKTLAMLCKARKIAGVPFIINSGFRTLAHNKKVGGVENSAHTRGYAVDISTPNGENQLLIVKALLKAGFVRFGIYTNFIHVDNDPDKPQYAYWGTAKDRFNPFRLTA